MPASPYKMSLLPYASGIGAAFNTFTSRQDVSPQPLPVLRAGMAQPGTILELEADGEYSSLTGASLTLGFWFGTAAASITGALAEDSAQTTGTTPASWPFHLEWRGVVTNNGSSTGSITGSGFIDFSSSLVADTRRFIPTTLALRTVAIDFTIDRAFGVCATYGASSGSNQVKVYELGAWVTH